MDAAEAAHDAEVNGWGDRVEFIVTNIVQESPALWSWDCSCEQRSANFFRGAERAQAAADRHQDAHDKGWVK